MKQNSILAHDLYQRRVHVDKIVNFWVPGKITKFLNDFLFLSSGVNQIIQ